MKLPIFAGIYATSPTLYTWNENQESEYINRIQTQLPQLSGLELPCWQGDLSPYSFSFIKEKLPKNWKYLLTLIPMSMKNLERNPLIGLSSHDQSGRREAVKMVKSIIEEVKKINDFLGENRFLAMHLCSSPIQNGFDREKSIYALSKSFEEIIKVNSEIVNFNLEHCDSAENPKYVKGFMRLEDEIRVIKEFDGKVKMTVNWGRSVIEGRSTLRVRDHIRFLKDQGLLSGLIFSGTQEYDVHYGEWTDRHIPVSTCEPNSLMTPLEIKECLNLAGNIDYTGFKVLAEPEKIVGLERRVEVNLKTFEAIREGLR